MSSPKRPVNLKPKGYEVSAETQARESTPARSRKKALIGVYLLFFVILCALALVLCNLRAQYVSQDILANAKDIEQTYIDKNLNTIRVWQNELVNQARFISTSEMFRLFIHDTRSLAPSEIAYLSNPDALSSTDETVRSMAEQLTFIQDLLNDFTQRRAWTDVRLLQTSGVPMVEPPFSQPLSGMQTAIAKKAADTGQATFGPIRKSDKGYYIDLADPLFEVMGTGEKETVVGVLLLSQPLEKPLATFLSRTGEQTEVMWPKIISQDGDSFFAVMAQAGTVVMEPVTGDIKGIAPVPFELRKSLDGISSVYSMGAVLPELNWLYLLETPSQAIDERIRQQKLQIYGIGILASIGIALLCAWIWAGYSSRRHKAQADLYQGLWHTISEQKLMLDSVYASFQAGIILVDSHGRVLMSNPTFCEMFGHKEALEKSAPLVECMPSKFALKLLQDIQDVQKAESEGSVVMTLPTYGIRDDGEPEDRIYRITLYPYTDIEKDAPRFTGCVLIFKDITKYRLADEEKRKAQEIAQKRQEALIDGFVKAVESVDPNLVGHSAKMSALSQLLAKELMLEPKEAETLRLAANLSQIGKIFLPHELHSKKGSLTEEEKNSIREASIKTDQVLHDLHFDLPVADTVKLMGERIDGSGKPYGLRKDQISLVGRTLAVINSFIAQTSNRAWRGESKLSRNEAIQRLKHDPGFDISIVQALENIPKQDMDAALGKETD